MGNDVYLVFSDPGDTVDLGMFNAFQDQHILENLEVPGFVSCRRYSFSKMRGEEYPARFSFLSLYEVDKPQPELREGLRERSTRRVRPEWMGDVALSAQMGEWLEGDLVLNSSDHFVFVFTSPPEGMTFDAYDEWYPEHIQQNIRASEHIFGGWRYRLPGAAEAGGEIPSHVAIYGLSGPADEMLVDVQRAVASGATTMLDSFHMFSSFDTTALGERQLAR